MRDVRGSIAIICVAMIGYFCVTALFVSARTLENFAGAVILYFIGIVLCVGITSALFSALGVFGEEG